MSSYKKTDVTIWTGRVSDVQLYLHEKIKCIDLENEALPIAKNISFAILGYACDEGVRRNQGRTGAIDGPDMIRRMLAPLANHFKKDVQILDVGDIICHNTNLEKTQSYTTDKIHQLLINKYFTICLGGGHDLSYAHYNGLKRQFSNSTIGIINLDAHFDLRKISDKGNSGTPFYQISKENDHFNYLCLGIQEESNNKELFETANKLGVRYIKNTDFTIQNKDNITPIVNDFISAVDHIYLTIDLDGFSSVLAPGVSAPSPVGFSADIALTIIEQICTSGKLISLDIVELNPKYDIDNCTARLAARLIYSMIQFFSNTV